MTTIKEYYKLKEVQEKQLKKLKTSIFLKTNSKKERKELLKKKFKCFNCKKEGGVIFYSTYDTLFAKCNAKKPCDLSISIKKNHSKFLPHLKLYEKINHLKELLIELKTKNLFRYLDDDTTIESMEELVSNIEENTLIYKKVMEPIDNTELKRLEETLFQIISEMKEKEPSEYIEIHTTILKETLERIRELKYHLIEKTTIESNPGELNTLATTMNKVIFSTDDITDYTIDIKSI